MNIPTPELRKAERKCNILAEIDEDFSHVIEDLERRYKADIRVQVIRPVVGGGVGSEQIILTEVESVDRSVEQIGRASS
jgi:hypothetical protein